MNPATWLRYKTGLKFTTILPLRSGFTFTAAKSALQVVGVNLYWHPGKRNMKIYICKTLNEHLESVSPERLQT